MASRKEQKERLRREREEREAATKATEQRRRRLIGYGAAGAVILIAVVVGVVLLSGGSESTGGKETSADVLPSGGSIPASKTTDLDAAVKAAGCTISEFPGKSREHTGNLAEKITYDSSPPTEGKHFQEPAADGAYEQSPDVKQLVHTLEHGRVIIWFPKRLPAGDRADLKAFFDEDQYHMVLTPDTTGMKYAVAASAWNRDPQPNGTGRLLGCPKFSPAVFDALRAFREDNRDSGPEVVP